MGGDELSELLTELPRRHPDQRPRRTSAIHRNTFLSLARRAGAAERDRIIDRNLEDARRLY